MRPVLCPDCGAPFTPYSGQQTCCRACYPARDRARRQAIKRLRRNLPTADPCAACWFYGQCRDVTQNICDDPLPCFPASPVHRAWQEVYQNTRKEQ